MLVVLFIPLLLVVDVFPSCFEEVVRKRVRKTVSDCQVVGEVRFLLLELLFPRTIL